MADKVYVGEYNSTMLIIVKNTTAHPVAIDGNRLVTTKEDARIHGLGSKNVADAVARYEGLLTYSYDAPWFEVKICM
ncbi:MAG: GHKL domain-containing protein [Clostridiales bacterium]|nr:GHKL domain-containing protein [Clostridiales bacterium]